MGKKVVRDTYVKDGVLYVGTNVEGVYAMVDEKFSEKVLKHNWYLHKHGYAVTKMWGVMVPMHRMVVGEVVKGFVTDHINRIRLDNREVNLRVIPRLRNNLNRSLNSNNKSGCRGVVWNKRAGKWTARIQVAKTRLFLGYFDSVESATEAYRAKSDELNKFYTK